MASATPLNELVSLNLNTLRENLRLYANESTPEKMERYKEYAIVHQKRDMLELLLTYQATTSNHLLELAKRISTPIYDLLVHDQDE
jgi:hypothetical protein